MSDRTAYILVTGSRSLRSYGRVADALDQAWTEAVQNGYNRLVVVHGAASGADSMAERWVQKHQARGVEQRRFPADWSADCSDKCQPGHRRPRAQGGTYCPTEGNFRNQRMVDHVLANAEPGGMLCIAVFAQAHSPGTADCSRRAEKAGIPTRRLGNPPAVKGGPNA